MDISKQYPNLLGDMNFPVEGKLVEVDYEYFKFALEMLLSLCSSRLGGERILIDAEERSDSWIVRLKGVAPDILDVIRSMVQCKTIPQSSKILSAENILQLHIICEILHFQKISFEFPEKLEGLALVVPTYGE